MRFAVLCLLPAALCAQAPPAADSLASISGQVINASTAEPVRGALLYLRRIDESPRLQPGGTRTATSDAAGRFAIAGIEPGKYRLSAERNGFLTSQFGSRGPNRPGSPITLDQGQKSTGLLLSLTPHAVISGRVQDENGDPAQGVDVQAAKLQYVQGRKQFARSGGALTNDLGEFRIYGLAPGRYYLSAAFRPNPLNAEAGANDEDYVLTYYPRTADPAAAAPLDLTPGAQLRGIDVTLTRQHTITLRGRVVNEIQAPAADARPSGLNVILAPRNPLGAGAGYSRGGMVTGQNFEFTKVPPGSYLLIALLTIGGRTHTARVPVQAGSANIEDLTIALRPGVTVAGRVKIDGETSASLTKVHVVLTPFEVTAGNVFFGPMPDQPLKPDLTFELPDAAAERFRVNATPLPEGFYVKSIRSGHLDVLADGLDIAGGVPAPLEIVLSPNAGELTGVVLDPKTHQPVPAVTAVLVPQEKDRRAREAFYKVSTTDQSGRFTFKNLVPGEYKVFSWEEVAYGSWMDPDFLAPHESRGEAVTIREGAPQTVQVNLIPDA